MPQPVGRGQRYMPGLDGLRAIAVLAVVAFHLNPEWAPGGLLGVGIFFTLSGYLITDLLLGQRAVTGRLKLGEFWIRRARRLLPAVFLMIAVVVAWVAVFESSRLAALRGDVLAATFYVSNWWNIAREASYFARFGPPPPLDHLWSLAVEEQFYLIWPWFLWIVFLLTRGRHTLAGITMIGLTLVGAALSALAMWTIYQPGIDPTRVYEGTDTRAFGLLIGAALAMVWPSRRLSAALAARWRVVLDGVGLIGLVVMALLIWRTSQYSPFLYHGGIVLLSVGTAATVAALVHPASWLGVAVGWKPLRWLGVRSYGIYLWHWPIIVLTAPSLRAEANLSVQAAQLAATIIIAALSWRYFEEPIRRGAIGRIWAQLRSGGWPRRPVITSRASRRRRYARQAVLVVALVVVALDGAALGGLIKAQPQASGLAVSSQMAHSGPGVSTHRTVAPPAAEKTTAGSAREAEPEKSVPQAEKSQSGSGEAAPPKNSSCRSVAYIGDSTSEGMILPNYLPNYKQRLDAQYARVGATSQFLEISGARSIVETLSQQQASGLTLARELEAKGFDGCYVVALGTNDAANVYVGSVVDLETRIEQMMRIMGGQPVLWITAKSLLTSGPYSQENMQRWNSALENACPEYPNMRVFDWASLTEDHWFIEDGTHYTSEGYRNRARLTADALAHAFPSSGDEQSPDCVVR